MQKLGMKPVPGISKVTIKKSKNVSTWGTAACLCMHLAMRLSVSHALVYTRGYGSCSKVMQWLYALLHA